MAFWNFLKREQPMISVDDILANIISKSEISIEQALNVPGLSSCVDFISQKIAELPIKLYKETDSGTTEEIKNDNRVSLLNDDTGDLLDCFQMKQAVIRDMLLSGTGYIYPEWERNSVVSLRYVDRKYVTYNINSDPIFKKADYLIYGRTYRDDDLIRVCRNTKNGIYGTGFVDEHNQILTVAYKSLIYEKCLVATGGNKKGFLKSSKRMDKEGLEVIRKQWNELHSNTGSTIMVLNEGLDFKESSNTSVEMQLQENKRTNNELICQLFGLSSDVLSGKANDEQYVNAIKIAVVPVVTEFQTALNKGLLLPSERRSMYFVLDMTELLKGDILKRYQAYQIGLSSSFLQPDEVRYKEDLEPLGFKWIKLGLNDVLLDTKNGTVYTPNTNQTTKLGAENANLSVDDSESISINTENRWDGQPRDSNGRFDNGSKGGKKFKVSRKEKSSENQTEKFTRLEKFSFDESNKQEKAKNIQQFSEESKPKVENANAVVDMKVINSAQFRKKIDKLGETTEVSREIYQQSKNILKHRSGTEYEDLVFIDTVKNKSMARIDYNVKRQCIPSKKMISMVENSAPHTIIAIHNHPNSSVPSLDDINNAWKKKYKYGMIACHNGNIFKYRVSGEYNKFIVNSLLDTVNKLVYNKNEIGNYDKLLVRALEQLKENNILLELI